MKKFPFRLLASFLIYLFSWLLYSFLFGRYIDDIGGGYLFRAAPLTVPFALALILSSDIILHKFKFFRERHQLLVATEMFVGLIVFIPSWYLLILIPIW